MGRSRTWDPCRDLVVEDDGPDGIDLNGHHVDLHLGRALAHARGMVMARSDSTGSSVEVTRK